MSRSRGRQRYKLKKEVIVLIILLMIGAVLYFVVSAATTPTGEYNQTRSGTATNVDFLQIESNHHTRTYTITNNSIAFGFNDFNFVDEGEFVYLVEYHPRDGRIVLHTTYPAVIEASLNPSTNNIDIYIINPREVYNNILIIDPGHGGGDVGAPVPHLQGVYESHIVMAISNYLYQLFEASDVDIKVFMTRHGDYSLGMRNRTNLGNTVGDMLLSIHTNTFVYDTAVSGTEVLFNPTRPVYLSRLNITNSRLAQTFQDQLVASLNTRDRGIVDRRDLYLLNTSSIPTAFVEIDFKTNPEALQNLQSSVYQQRVAQALYEAIIAAFGLD